MVQKLFPVNQHPLERMVRVVLGVVLLGLALSGTSAWGYIGVVPLLTGTIGSCPAYTLFGLSTCPIKATAKTI
jgi:Protein of unknown function (DUF2892)